ncbi:hypothetical protein NECAME_08876 [Necator americanus]|uniref:Uncharacterized protein n=1 Tax=Necator americanus TaxID=51031 RepID=W2TIS0_NECAM|nr:hypothetical protein NECAME_08876 [Necator americanus]ETN80912.1 hypothetical protein NECAME_08876 [Necator americanus]
MAARRELQQWPHAFPPATIPRLKFNANKQVSRYHAIPQKTPQYLMASENYTSTFARLSTIREIKDI